MVINQRTGAHKSAILYFVQNNRGVVDALSTFCVSLGTESARVSLVGDADQVRIFEGLAEECGLTVKSLRDGGGWSLVASVPNGGSAQFIVDVSPATP